MAVRPSAFWDTSALLPVCLREPLSTALIQIYEGCDVVVWWAAPVEMESALARLARMRKATAAELTAARSLAARIAEAWLVISPTTAVRDRAIALVGQHELRAGDALQLSAALEWSGDRPAGNSFITADQRLRAAALHEGFVSPLLA